MSFSVLKVAHGSMSFGAGASSWLKTNVFNSANILARAGSAFSAAAILPLCKIACHVAPLTRSSADADNALDAKEAVPNKWRADGTHNTYQSQ